MNSISKRLREIRERGTDRLDHFGRIVLDAVRTAAKRTDRRKRFGDAVALRIEGNGAACMPALIDRDDERRARLVWIEIARERAQLADEPTQIL